MKKRLFGTAGVRGVTNTEITTELALKIAASYGTYLSSPKIWCGDKSKDIRKKQVVAIGFDTRYGADILAQASTSGLASVGIDVLIAGCITTGGLSTNVVKLKCDGGIMITGSHMPYTRIGIIILLPDGAYAPFDITDEIEDIYRDFTKKARFVQPEKIGCIKQIENPLEIYIDEMFNHIDIKAINPRKFKVLIDFANGTGSLVAKDFFEKLGCEVYEINGRIKPIPNRHPEPRAKNVSDAIDAVIDNRCDLGICLDVDADRVLFISKEGYPISEDVIGSIFVSYELAKEDVCVTPINSSGLIEFTCKKIGARLEYCKIGHPPTVEAIKKYKALFAYEESGKYYFPKHFYWCDGIFTGAKLLEIMAERNMSLSKLAGQFPKFYQVKKTIDTEEDKKDKIMLRVKKIWRKEAIENRVRDITIDGLKRMYKDYSWLLIRKSGTEPLIRVYSDAPSMKRAEELVKIGKTILRKAMQ